MSQSSFSFDIKSTDYSCPLGVSVWYNNTNVLHIEHLTEPTKFSHEFNDDIEDDHEIRIVMSGKKPEHTVVDDQGNFITDALLEFDEFYIDNLCVDGLIIKLVEYHHDFNGTGQPTVDKFFKQIGCNGTLIFRFSTPVYLWLLKHI
jgi:hypothetical protein